MRYQHKGHETSKQELEAKMNARSACVAAEVSDKLLLQHALEKTAMPDNHKSIAGFRMRLGGMIKTANELNRPDLADLLKVIKEQL